MIGVEDAAAGAWVAEFATSLGIPLAAIVSEREPRTRVRKTLRDPFRPVEGGVQIQSWDNTCTLGFSLSSGYFVTNSHCTDVSFARDGGWFEQPARTWDRSNLVGYEWDDPEPVFTYDFKPSACPYPSQLGCRYSDAAIVRYDGATPLFPYIAKPSSYSSPSYVDLYVPDGSRLKITGELQSRSPWQGELLDKIGRTTGWTSGRVSVPCMDVPHEDGVALLCQARVDAFNRGGDSGSPVFAWYGGDTVTLYGILWGGPDEGRFDFSSMQNVRYDLSFGTSTTY